MKVTYKWLQDYVDLDISPGELGDRLTLVGLEVEELEDRYAYLDQVVVARVAEVEQHPRSGHLKVCRVETGQQAFQVVCGAPNVKAGMISALALVGVELPNGTVVGETEIRGVTSTGMLCSEAELVVGPDASGIIELPGGSRLGQSLKQTLNLEDWVYEIGITPNRPDCLSIIGVAREAAGLLGKPLRLPAFQLQESGEKTAALTSVTIQDPEHCPRYVARVIRGLKIGPSPFWLVDRLAGVGLRSINNVVDITNFILMELGQPLHSFDMDNLAGGRIVVKLAGEGDRFVTLDGQERILGPQMLMICDAERPVAVGGVMGGLNSEIVPETTNVLLESAYFNPVSIRRTSKTLGLSTEASFRFERGIDPAGCLFAANRAAALISQLAGGTVAPEALDENPITYKKTVLPFSPAKCNAFLGTDFPVEAVTGSLKAIGLGVSGGGESLEIDVPPFRVDLEREVDIFEEVARLVGFDKVPVTRPAAKALPHPDAPSRQLRAEARNILEGLGLSEVINYSFISEDFCDRLGLPEDDHRRRTVRILNPLSEDQALMRTTLVPGLLDSLRRNQSHRVMDLALYEIGATFLRLPDEELPDEQLYIAGLLSGGRNALSWHHKPAPVDFFDAKGVVEDLLEGLNMPEAVFLRQDLPAYYESASSAAIQINGRTVGWLGRIAARTAEIFELRETPYVFELNVGALLDVRCGVPQYQSLPRYPFVERDLAVVMDVSVPAGQVVDFIQGLGEELLTEVTLFDAYEGKQVGEGQRSLAFRLTYRSPERTLTDEEVNTVHQRITEKVIEAFAASLRS